MPSGHMRVQCSAFSEQSRARGSQTMWFHSRPLALGKKTEREKCKNAASALLPHSALGSSAGARASALLPRPASALLPHSAKRWEPHFRTTSALAPVPHTPLPHYFRIGPGSALAAQDLPPKALPPFSCRKLGSFLTKLSAPRDFHILCEIFMFNLPQSRFVRIPS